MEQKLEIELFTDLGFNLRLFFSELVDKPFYAHNMISFTIIMSFDHTFD